MKPKMNYDATQNRWRKMYKGKNLAVKCSDLGGIGYHDTLIAANYWFNQQKQEIDLQKASQIFRQNEAEYLTELDSLTMSVKALQATRDKTLLPLIESMKAKIAVIRQRLTAKFLSPLPDNLRNPLNIPEQKQREIVDREYYEKYFSPLWDAAFADDSTYEGQKEIGKKIREKHAESRESIVSEFQRGRIHEIMKDQNINVPESKLISHYIDRYLEFQTQRHKLGKIGVPQLSVNHECLEYYKNWLDESGIRNIKVYETKEHVDSYYNYIVSVTKGNYAKRLWDGFKRFYQWMFHEEIITKSPPWFGRRDDKYKIVVEKKDFEVISIPVLRRLYDTASDTMKLYFLLGLNCGFGQNEIAGLEIDEIDLKEGRITHKRLKTKKHSRVPEVSYKLWDRTIEYLVKQLDKQKSCPARKGCEKLLLRTTCGTPLVRESFDGKRHRNDVISCNLKRLEKKIKEEDKSFPHVHFYQFRKTSSNLVKNNLVYRSLCSVFLDHAPITTDEKHYSTPLKYLLDDCLVWLEKVLFEDKIAEQ